MVEPRVQLSLLRGRSVCALISSSDRSTEETMGSESVGALLGCVLVLAAQVTSVVRTNKEDATAPTQTLPPPNHRPYPNFTETERTVTSEQRDDGVHHKVTITKKVRIPYEIEVQKHVPKIVEIPVDKPFNIYVPKPYPVVVEKKVPYEVKVPVPQPYTVEKKIPYPVKVLVEKPYTVHIPKPYPVEVEKKYEFPVEKKVPYEVKVPVERPYPVPVLVEKEVKVPVETKVPVPVKVPFEKPVPVEVEKHIPILVDKPIPYTVEHISPYPVRVPFRIPVKVHYPVADKEFRAAENKYHKELSWANHNAEWSDIVGTATKPSSQPVKGFPQSFEPPHFDQKSEYSFYGSPHRHRGYIFEKNVKPKLSHSYVHSKPHSAPSMSHPPPSESPILPPTPPNDFRDRPSYQVTEDIVLSDHQSPVALPYKREQDKRQKGQALPNRGFMPPQSNFNDGNLRNLLSASPHQFPNSQETGGERNSKPVTQKYTANNFQVNAGLPSRVPHFLRRPAPNMVNHANEEYNQGNSNFNLNSQNNMVGSQTPVPWNTAPPESSHPTNGNALQAPNQYSHRLEFNSISNDDKRSRFPYHFQRIAPTASPQTHSMNTGVVYTQLNRPEENDFTHQPFPSSSQYSAVDNHLNQGSSEVIMDDPNDWSPLHSYGKTLSSVDHQGNWVQNSAQVSEHVYVPAYHEVTHMKPMSHNVFKLMSDGSLKFETPEEFVYQQQQMPEASSTPPTLFSSWSPSDDSPSFHYQKAPMEQNVVLTASHGHEPMDSFIPSGQLPSSYAGAKTYLSEEELVYSSSVLHGKPRMIQ